ncbi:cytochrome-c peroxidase [Halomonas alkalisoli]|uniref:cytochrome-c peroxidase n=1 Tax=Halomonas alkalisoli TaxID=2907158 RepID=UPI001F423D0B|nr:cytochrome c peroxidase [Halomonas alkalisoli]MCE9682501.1 photosynthetic protein synthase I [Halomonas alkalisoli]
MKRQIKRQAAMPIKGALCFSGAVLLSWSMVTNAEPAVSSELAPLPPAPQVNEKMAELGRHLFFDRRLSGNTSHSCASCHDPEKGWGTGEPMSHGYTGVLYFRNSPGLFNAAHRERFMWDGRLDGDDLGTLVRDMLTEAHTMNMDSRLAQERLKQIPEYMEMFEEVYGAEPYGGRIYGAIGEFLKTIRTVNAPLDDYLRGDGSALSDEAKRGKELFTGKAGCVQCHSGPTLSDGNLYALGVPDHPGLFGDGIAAVSHEGHEGSGDNGESRNQALRQVALLRHYASMGTPNYMNLRSDVGLYVVTKDNEDVGKFMTPSLWDVGHTAPYMHSGVLETLEDVVDFYAGGGGKAKNKSELIQPFELSESEKSDLVAFLESMAGDAPQVAVPEMPAYQVRQFGQN